MLLTCPSCKARYNAPDDAIPEGGRTLQCSACDAEWREAGPPIERTRPAAPPPPAPDPGPDTVAIGGTFPQDTSYFVVEELPGPSQEDELADSLMDDAPPPARAGGGAFSAGFALVVLLATLAGAVYVQRDAVVAAAPGAEATVDSYVAVVDDARLRLAALAGR